MTLQAFELSSGVVSHIHVHRVMKLLVLKEKKENFTSYHIQLTVHISVLLLQGWKQDFRMQEGGPDIIM